GCLEDFRKASSLASFLTARRLAVRSRRRSQLVRDGASQGRRREHLGLRAELQDPSPQLARVRHAQAEGERAVEALLDARRAVPLPLADPSRACGGAKRTATSTVRPPFSIPNASAMYFRKSKPRGTS